MRSLAVMLLIAVSTGPAFSGTITFNGIGGVNGDPFTTYVESGFTVTPTTGIWKKGFGFGNPVPSIFSPSATASITVTGGTFDLISFDFGNANNLSGLTWSAAGFLNNVQVLSGSGNGPSTVMFITVPSPNSAALLDTLVLTGNLGNTSSYNFDNIVLSSVPEPSTITFFAMGLVLAGFCRRRSNGLNR